MGKELNLVFSAAPQSHGSIPSEICEHKGLGHPDSLCDDVAEAASRALCAAYLQAYGEIRHHNVDKALLIGGQSSPRFGGGHVSTRMRLIVAGRADDLPREGDVGELVIGAARRYLASTLRVAPDLFDIESAVRTGSPNLRRVVAADNGIPLANDTSFGVGFAPYSALEQAVLDMAGNLRSDALRSACPWVGDDFKIMGWRVHARLGFTVALAIVDREVRDAAHYFLLKQQVMRVLHAGLPGTCELRINTLDNPLAEDESGIYLTVTGLSAEHGDDGEVGRGNRVSGLITPSRPMSLEAAAGKNPVSHVGKIYNVLAGVIAKDLVSQVEEIAEASVQLLSAIGQPIDRPALVAVQVAGSGVPLSPSSSRTAREIVRGRLDTIQSLTRQLASGEAAVF